MFVNFNYEKEGGKMYKHEKYPYGCIELESSKGLLKESNLEWLSDSYSKADIVEKSGEIFKHIRNNISDKEKKFGLYLAEKRRINGFVCRLLVQIIYKKKSFLILNVCFL